MPPDPPLPEYWNYAEFEPWQEVMTPTLKELKLVSYKIKFEDTDDCYKHIGYTNKLGYVQLQFSLNKVKFCIEAHRAAYMIHNNVQLTKDDIVMHSCDNPGCVNIKHLSVGTHNDNVQDRVSKNRSAVIQKNGRYVHGKYVGRTKRQRENRVNKQLLYETENRLPESMAN